MFVNLVNYGICIFFSSKVSERKEIHISKKGIKELICASFSVSSHFRFLRSSCIESYHKTFLNVFSFSWANFLATHL